MNLIEKEQLRSKIAELSTKPNLSATERTQLNALLAQVADVRATEQRAARAEAALASAKKDLNITEERDRGAASMQLRDMLRGEARTYSPMSLGTEGTSVIAAQFADKLVQAQKAAGPFFCGSPVLSNIERNTTGTMKLPVVDDTSASGFVLTENSSIGEQEVTGFQSSSIGTKTFSSGIVLASLSLVEDVNGWANYETLLASTIGKRLSRIQNATFVPQLMTALTANSSAAVAAAGSTLAESDVENVVSAVDASYRQSASCGFVMNGATQKALSLLKDTTGRRLFKKILEQSPEIYGYPVYICPSVDSVGSGKNPVLFGDLSYVYTRSIPSYEVKVLREQFILNRQVGLIMAKRGDLAYSLPTTADSAVKYIAVS
jgi:HK97 family phage major capsid protein